MWPVFPLVLSIQRSSLTSHVVCAYLLTVDSTFTGKSQCLGFLRVQQWAQNSQPWTGSELAVAYAGDGSKCSVPICADCKPCRSHLPPEVPGVDAQKPALPPALPAGTCSFMRC